MYLCHHNLDLLFPLTGPTAFSTYSFFLPQSSTMIFQTHSFFVHLSDPGDVKLFNSSCSFDILVSLHILLNCLTKEKDVLLQAWGVPACVRSLMILAMPVAGIASIIKLGSQAGTPQACSKM